MRDTHDTILSTKNGTQTVYGPPHVVCTYVYVRVHICGLGILKKEWNKMHQNVDSS